MSSTTVNNYSERLKKAGVPSLGRLVWFSVSEVRVDHSLLVNILAQSGLASYLPKIPSDVDVFRRVCSSAQRKRVPATSGTVNNYLVRDVGYDGDGFYKRIVRETVDPSGHRLDYVEMCDVTFDRITSEVTIVCSGDSDDDAETISAEIKTEYAAQRGCLNSYGVRELVRKALLDVGATNVRGPAGGVYFVAESQSATVESLEAAATALCAAVGGGVVDIHSLPLVDDDKQRAMVRKAFESETVGQAGELLNEITDLLGTDKTVTTERKVALLERYHQMASKVASYSELLEDSVDVARSHVEIVKLQLMTLQAR